MAQSRRHVVDHVCDDAGKVRRTHKPSHRSSHYRSTITAINKTTTIPTANYTLFRCVVVEEHTCSSQHLTPAFRGDSNSSTRVGTTDVQRCCCGTARMNRTCRVDERNRRNTSQRGDRRYPKRCGWKPHELTIFLYGKYGKQVQFEQTIYPPNR